MVRIFNGFQLYDTRQFGDIIETKTNNNGGTDPTPLKSSNKDSIVFCSTYQLYTIVNIELYYI
jgi:hypothetical protein